MRIEEIHVDGFGLMHGRVVQPDAGLTVVRGMNEAGKTTLLSFIRTILFGFDGRSYRAMAGGRRGGWLNVRARDGRGFRIERYGETGGLGRLRVLDEQDADLGAGELAVLMQGVDGTLFRNVFAFGLAELAEFKKLTDDQVTARIYGAGLALGPVSPIEIEASLREARENLFKPGGQNPTINAILRELEDIDDELRKADLPATYDATVQGLARRDTRLGELHEAIASAGDERRRAERLRDAWAPWLVWRETESARVAYEGVPILPVDLAERLAVLEVRSEGGCAQLDDVGRRRGEQEIALAKIDVDTSIVACRAEVEDLGRAAERDRVREKELATVVDQIRAAEGERDDALLRLGAGWTSERVAAFDDSVTVQSEISGRFRERLDLAAAALAGARSAHAQAGRELEAVIAEHTRIAAEIEEIAALDDTGPDLGEQEPAIGALEAGLAERDRAARRAASAAEEARLAADGMPRTQASVAEDQRVAHLLRESLLEQRQAAALLASLPDAATTGPQPSSATLLGPVLIGAVGVVAALAALVLGVPVPVAVLIAVAGLLGAGAAWMMLRTRPRSPATAGFREGIERRVVDARMEAGTHAVRFGLTGDASVAEVDAVLERCAVDERTLARIGALREADETAARELAQAEAALEPLARATGLASAPTAEALGNLRVLLQAARDRRARRLGLTEQATTLSRRMDEFERSVAEAVRRAEEAEAESRAAREEWSGWLTAHGLDAGLDRETAKTVIDAVTTAKRPLRSLATLVERRQTLSDQHDGFVDQAAAVAAQAGWTRPRPTDRSSLDRLVADLADTLEAALEAEWRRDKATETLEGLVREVAQARETAEGITATLSALLAEFGAQDAATLREAIGRSDAARSLDDRIEECRRTLTALSGPGAAFDTLLGELDDIAELDAISSRLDAIGVGLGELEEEQGRLREDAGAMREQIATMERDVAATESRQAREDLLGRLADAAERWSVAALARHLLRQSRETYEAAHRPAVIETAERYFTEWTAGRYRRIVAPLGQQIEAVEHRDGTQVAIGDLSTGTAQQLYLAIRFGLVEHFSEAAEPLPIVMDDILVNFDDERATLAARSIESLAERHQVIYFTCHPETPLVGGLQVHLDRLDTLQ